MSSHVTGRLPRRTLIAAAASAAVAGGLGFRPNAARARTPTADIDWAAFDAAVQDGMHTFGLVGAAIAIVTADGIDHRNTYGVRDLRSGAPFTPDTHCLVGSTTKSMSLLCRGWRSRMSSACAGWLDLRSGRAQGAKPARRRPRTHEPSGTAECQALGILRHRPCYPKFVL